MTPAGVLNLFYRFENNPNDPDTGCDPESGVTLGTDGNFYGSDILCTTGNNVKRPSGRLKSNRRFVVTPQASEDRKCDSTFKPPGLWAAFHCVTRNVGAVTAATGEACGR